MMHFKNLETDRLILRKVIEDDSDLIYHLDSDPKVLKHIGLVKTMEESKDRVRRSIAQYNDGTGLGRWMALEKESQRSFGWFILCPLEDSGYIEIGYRLKEEFWGHGYATEGSNAILKYGFEILGLKEIVGITSNENISSQNVLTKIGLQYKREDTYYGHQVRFYSLLNKAK